MTTGPTSPPMAASTTDKVLSATTYAMNTALITGAPALNNLNSNINPHNAGGIAVTLIGDGITTIIQALKMHKWFDQNRYAIWMCILLSLIICTILYIVLLHDPEQGVLNALGAMYKAASNYGPLNKLGVLGSGTDSTQ